MNHNSDYSVIFCHDLLSQLAIDVSSHMKLMNTNVFSHVMECTLVCSAISGVRYSRFALLSHLIECVTIRVPVYIGIFCISRSIDGISRYITVNFLLFCR